MSSQIRKYLRLLEFFQTDHGNRLPPPRLKDRGGDGGRPEGGKFWISPEGIKIRVPEDDDYTQMLYRSPEDFDTTTTELTRFLKSINPNTAQNYRKWLAIARPNDPNAAPTDSDKTYTKDDFTLKNPNLTGVASNIAMKFLFDRGWCYLEYNYPIRANVHCARNHAKQVLHTLGSIFPMIQIENITVSLFKEEKGALFKSIRFSSEDTQNFSGAFGEALQWAKTGVAPIQKWYYVILPGTEIDTRLTSSGLVPKQHKSGVYKVNFYPPFPPEMWKLFHRLAGNDAIALRFPAEVTHNMNVNQANDKQSIALYSTKPFVIPRDVLQQYVRGKWVPLDR